MALVGRLNALFAFATCRGFLVLLPYLPHLPLFEESLRELNRISDEVHASRSRCQS